MSHSESQTFLLTPIAIMSPTAMIITRLDLLKLTGGFIFYIYPTGQNYSLELMFAKFATAKIANDLNPLKQTSNRLYMPENNNGVL